MRHMKEKGIYRLFVLFMAVLLISGLFTPLAFGEYAGQEDSSYSQDEQYSEEDYPQDEEGNPYIEEAPYEEEAPYSEEGEGEEPSGEGE